MLLAAMLLPLTVLSNGSTTTALASPTTSPRLEDQLDRLNRQADELVEQYNQSNLVLERLQKSRKNLITQATGAEADLRLLQARLGARASAAYVQGAGSAVAAVLGSDDPASAIDRVQVLDLLASHDGDLMDRLGVAGKALDARKSDLVAAEKAQAAEVAKLGAKKAEIDRAVARTKALLRQMEAKQAASRPRPPSGPSNPPPVSSPPPSGGGGSGSAAAAVSYAMAQVGKPYCYGGAGSSCYDCSGLTMMAWRQAGISLPHSSAAQINVGRRVSASELRPGDLVFYYSPISHVSMYIGNGQRVSATHTGDYVRVQSLGSGIVGYARPSG